MKNLTKYGWLLISAITLSSCQGGNSTNNSSSTAATLSPLAQYKALLVYNRENPLSKTFNSSATQNNQQSFTVSNNTITLTNVKVNFYKDSNCSRDSLVNSIDLSGGSGVAFQPGTYTSSGASNLALCGKYPQGCQGLFDAFFAGNTVAMSFEYTYAGGKIYSGACMAGSQDNGGETIINWSANSGLTPWSPCTNISCGFSQAYNVALPESSSLTSSFMLVGTGGMITNYDPYPGAFNNILYPAKTGIKNVAFTLGGHVIAVGYNGVILVADDVAGTNMKAANSSNINNLNSVVSSNGIYVAVGDGGTVLRSTDGINWRPAENNNGTNSNLNSVTADQNGNFVAVGAEGTILSSNGGDIWTSNNIGSTIVLYGVAYSTQSESYVAVGVDNNDGSSVVFYYNGSDWGPATGSFNGTMYSVATTPTGGFVATNDRGNVYYSTNNSGTQWSGYPKIHPLGIPPTLYGVTVDSNGTITTVGLDQDLGSGVIYKANNPTSSESWELVTTTDSTQLNGVASAGTDKYIAVGGYANENQVIMSSTDDQTWTNLNALTNNNLQGIACTNIGTFSAVGENSTTLTSSNGTSWSVNSPTFSSNAYSVMATNSGLFFLGGSQGIIESSTTGITWNNSYSGGNINIRAIAESNNSSIIAVGDNKTILLSNNYGISWSALISPISGEELHGVAINNSGVVVTVGTNNLNATIYSSADNDNFATSRINSGISSILYGVAVNSSGRFVAVGQTAGGSSAIVYSDDGINWTLAQISSGIIAPLYAISVNSSGLFVAVGDSGLVLTSIDGKAWNQQAPIVNGVPIYGITAY